MPHLVCDLEELKITEEELYVSQASTSLLTLTHFLVLKEMFGQVHSTYRDIHKEWDRNTHLIKFEEFLDIIFQTIYPLDY